MHGQELACTFLQQKVVEKKKKKINKTTMEMASGLFPSCLYLFKLSSSLRKFGK